jgi:hypothetical protein
MPKLESLGRELMGNGQLVRNFILCLLRNLKWPRQEFKMLKEAQQKAVVEALQQEQIQMLEMIFAISIK